MTSLSSSNFDQTSHVSSPLASSLPTHAGDDSLATILQSAKERLINFSSSDAAVDQMVSLFENAKVADVEFLLSSWSSGDFSTLPTFAVLEDANMRGAQGAFASESNTVYLSDLLTQQRADQHLDPLTGAVGVAIEEIGHSVDDLLNPSGDTAGDEGELFKAVVLGWVLSNEEKVVIAQEDDTSTIIVNNRSVTVEQAVRRGNSANNTVKGTSSRDYLYGKDGNDKLYGYNGNDKLYGGRDDDKLYGGSGDDYLSGWSGNDYLSGWYGNDRLYGGSGNDHLNGGSGNDRLYGYTGKDKLYGSYGDDRLYGSSGDDLLYGGSGNDKLYGGTNNDYLSGWSGNDYLSGWSGNDILKGYGKGTNERDTLRGGSGNDTFLLGDIEGVYYSKNGNADYATLVDLEPDNDTVQLHKFNNTVYSTSRAYGYRLQVVGEDTWLRRDNDGQAIALIEGQTNLNLLSDTFSYVGEADLSFGSVSASPTVYTNGKLQLSSNIKNNGVTGAERQNIQYWLSNDATLDTDSDWLLASHSINNLAPGTSGSYNWNVTYNTAWGTGTKYVFFQVDSDNDIEESNESNNIASRQITIAAPKPDLVISSFSSPSVITAGNTVNLTAYTRNQGSGSATGSSVRFWLSNDNVLNTSTDRFLSFKNVSALSAGSSQGQSYSFNYNASWGTGTKYLFAQADGYNVVSEGTESNNTTYRKLTINAPKPDLVVQSQSAPSTVTAGNTVNISARTKNNSSYSTAGSSRLRYWLSDDTTLNTSTDRYLGYDSVGDLAAGATEYDNFSFTYNASWGAGTKYILFQADGINNVSETNENNNVAYRTINVQQPKPDLTVLSVATPGGFNAGTVVNITALTRNNSRLTSVGSSQLRYWLSDDAVLDTATDRYLGSDTVGPLAAFTSETDTFSFTYNPSWGSGHKYILFQADGAYQYAETNEDNNIFSTKVNVIAPKPDLTINSTYGPSVVTTGQTVSVGAYTKNSSTLATAGSSQIRYWLSDDRTLNTSTDRYLGFDAVGALGKGGYESDNISFTYNASWGTGTKYILFQADGAYQVSEANEINNIAYKAMTVTSPKPDLVTQSQYAPTSVKTGSTVSISAHTRNTGQATASAGSTRYWLSNDATLNTTTDRYLGQDSFGALAAGASEYDSHAFTYDTSWGVGTKYIFFQTDYYNQTRELNENNNVAYRTINVSTPKADLVVDSQSAPSTITVGDSVNVGARVKNNSLYNVASGYSYLRYWLSDDTTLNTSVDRSLGSDYVASLSKGSSESESHSFTYDASWGTGRKYILYQADGYNYVGEENENNNIVYRSIVVNAPKSDLVVQNQYAPTTVKTGQSITINAQTKNIGRGTSNASRIHYWLSDDAYLNTASDRRLNSDYVGSLAQNSSESDSLTFTYNEDWGVGRKYIFFQADGGNVVSESNESNNIAYKSILITASEVEAPETYKPFDVNKVFSLNSNANADHIIYLDFNGHKTTNTLWNENLSTWNSPLSNNSEIVTPSYDMDGDGSSFSIAERQAIWDIWRRVSEDFAPFNVNVTTKAPSLDQLRKTSTSDTQWGVRVAIGGKSSDWYNGRAYGVAFENTFSEDSDTPVFVFSANTSWSTNEKYVAEAVSHEVGHALGLEHDGYDKNGDGFDVDGNGKIDDEDVYYEGHGSGITGWAPILGKGYYQNLTQWSNADYNRAINELKDGKADPKKQDDLKIIAGDLNGFGYRDDDYGNNRFSAKALHPYTGSQIKAYGIIEQNTDDDWFSFTSSTGRINLSFDVFEKGPNLDLAATLYDETGREITGTESVFLKDVLDGDINIVTSAGKYYLKVTGVGQTGENYYSDYGSLGQYSITGTIA